MGKLRIEQWWDGSTFQHHFRLSLPYGHPQAYVTLSISDEVMASLKAEPYIFTMLEKCAYTIAELVNEPVGPLLVQLHDTFYKVKHSSTIPQAGVPPRKAGPRPVDTYRQKAASEFKGVGPLDESLWGSAEGIL